MAMQFKLKNSLQKQSCRTLRRLFSAATLLALPLCIADQSSSVALGQSSKLPSMNPLLSDNQPPGMVGDTQLQRMPQLRGYFQPVEIRGPAGTMISFANDGFFGEPVEQPARGAMLIGPPYRLKITGIAFQPEMELFPTIEIIDRTYPPPEKAHRFPIIIELDQDDLDAAMRGDLVTRVVYLEDSQNAEPVSYAGGPQRAYIASPTENMLQTADTFGRPLAIIRLGSRVPALTDGTAAMQFLYGSPPVLPLKSVPDAEKLYDEGLFERYQPGEQNSQTSSAKTQPAKPAQQKTNTQKFRSASSGRIGDDY